MKTPLPPARPPDMVLLPCAKHTDEMNKISVVTVSVGSGLSINSMALRFHIKSCMPKALSQFRAVLKHFEPPIRTTWDPETCGADLPGITSFDARTTLIHPSGDVIFSAEHTLAFHRVCCHASAVRSSRSWAHAGGLL